MQAGFSYSESFHMAPRDARRYTAIQQAWSVGDNAEEGTRKATQADVDAL